MFNLTLIATLALSTLAYAQNGKSGHSEKGSKHDRPSQKEQTYVNHDKMRESNNHFNLAKVEQGGKQNKGNKGSSKHSEGPSRHHDSKLSKEGGRSYKTNSKPPKFVVHQQKGHGSKGNKPSQVHPSKKNSHVIIHQGKPHKVQYTKSHAHKAHKDYYGKGKKNKGHQIHYTQSHPNFAYLYVSTPDYYSHKNYGQWRSKEAKKKHKHYHPVYEYEAVEGFNFIVVRNNFLYAETQNKIVLVRGRLLSQRNAGTITVVEYDNSMRRIYVLEQRRAALEVNIVL